MNKEQRSGVGFFRGLLAVVRGGTHAFGKFLSVFGRSLAAATSRSDRKGGGQDSV
jgi:hypothetical protein